MLETHEAPHAHEAKQLAGLLADKLSKARVNFASKDLEQLPARELAAHLPSLPQQVL